MIPMTIATAKKTLNRARAEISRARRGDEEVIRQAAEKAWRAARESVYAVMDVVGQKPKESTVSPSTVASFEARYLGRKKRGSGQTLTAGYVRAIHVLHGLCFYDGECASKEVVEGEMDAVQDLIEQAEQDWFVLDKTERRRRR